MAQGQLGSPDALLGAPVVHDKMWQVVTRAQGNADLMWTLRTCDAYSVVGRVGPRLQWETK